MNAHAKALDSMFGDMDDLESKKMFGKKDDMNGDKGVSITISVSPGGDPDGDEFPEGHDEDMCKGGCAYHTGGTVPKPENEDSDLFSGYDTGDPLYKKGEMGMAKGGVVNPEEEDSEELDLPPFLRKKKK